MSTLFTKDQLASVAQALEAIKSSNNVNGKVCVSVVVKRNPQPVDAKQTPSIVMSSTVTNVAKWLAKHAH